MVVKKFSKGFPTGAVKYSNTNRGQGMVVQDNSGQFLTYTITFKTGELYTDDFYSMEAAQAFADKYTELTGAELLDIEVIA